MSLLNIVTDIIIPILVAVIIAVLGVLPLNHNHGVINWRRLYYYRIVHSQNSIIIHTVIFICHLCIICSILDGLTSVLIDKYDCFANGINTILLGILILVYYKLIITRIYMKKTKKPYLNWARFFFAFTVLEIIYFIFLVLNISELAFSIACFILAILTILLLGLFIITNSEKKTKFKKIEIYFKDTPVETYTFHNINEYNNYIVLETNSDEGLSLHNINKDAIVEMKYLDDKEYQRWKQFKGMIYSFKTLSKNLNGIWTNTENDIIYTFEKNKTYKICHDGSPVCSGKYKLEIDYSEELLKISFIGLDSNSIGIINYSYDGKSIESLSIKDQLYSRYTPIN